MNILIKIHNTGGKLVWGEMSTPLDVLNILKGKDVLLILLATKKLLFSFKWSNTEMQYYYHCIVS